MLALAALPTLHIGIAASPLQCSGTQKLNHCIDNDGQPDIVYDIHDIDKCCAQCQAIGPKCQAYEVDYNKGFLGQCNIYYEWDGGYVRDTDCDSGAPPPRPTPPDPPVPGGVTGSPCDPANFERGTRYDVEALGPALDLATLASPLNTNDTAAGLENFCCLYCVRDSRCRSWSLVGGQHCTLFRQGPGNRVAASGAVSGTPLPRVPDIPTDSQGMASCLSTYSSRGPFQVRRSLIGTPLPEVDTCTPCWKPEPDGAEYLIVGPTGTSQKFPVYVWMPAEGQSPGKYNGALEHIASYGFVVLSPFVDYSKCRSNLCDTTGAIYRNNSWPPSQTYRCVKAQCVPANGGVLSAADCLEQCGAIQPRDTPPNTTCTLAQVVRSEQAVRYALNELRTGAAGVPGWAAAAVDASLPVGVGGASATAPSVLKAVTHLLDTEQDQVAAVILQHPSYQPSHTGSLDSAFQKFAQRAAASLPLPALLAISGYVCARLGPCASVLYDKACRTAAASFPPDQATLHDCGDCTSHAGRMIAWSEFISRYATATANRVPAASIAGPWHHWVPQSALEDPVRRGCGGDVLIPETPAVVAWLSYALKGTASALSVLQACDTAAVSTGVENWILPRLDEDRLRDTEAGFILEQAVQKHGLPLQVPKCYIDSGRVKTHIKWNLTGAVPPTPLPPTPLPSGSA